MKKLFTLLTMLVIGIGSMWGQFVPDANAQYTLACCSSEAHSTSPFIGFNNNGEIDGQCTTGTRFKFELAPGNNDGYYIYVVEKEKYFNWKGSTNKVELNNSPTTVWKFKTTKDFNSSASTIPGKYGIIPYQNPNYSTVNNKSLNNYNATYNNLRIGPFNNATNACSHWTIAKWYDVSDTETLSEIKNYNSYDFFNVPSGSTLNIDVENFDLAKIAGAGTIVLAADNASLTGGKSTVATGKLIINEGKTLTLGTHQDQTNSIASFSSIDLAGQIKNNNSTLTLNSVTVPEGKNGVIFSYDMGKTDDGFKLAGTTTLNGDLVVCNTYNFQMKVDALAGNGTWTINGTTSSDYSAGTSSSEAATINVASASTYTGNVSVNNTNATVNVSGNLIASSWTKTNGTLKYKGNNLNGTTLDGVILAGSARLNLSNTVTIRDLAGNNLSNTTNNYALVGTGTLNLEGACDFTKKSDNTDCNCAKIGYRDGSSIIIKSGANVKVTKISYDTGDNAAITVEGTLTATKLHGPVTLAEGSVTTLSEATPFNEGAVTVSGDATLNLTATTSTLSQAITVDDSKTLTIDGKNNTVNLTGAVTNNGTINFKNATLTANLNDRTLANYTFTDCTATLQFVETGAEYAAGGFTITNIPEGVTVKVKKYGADYETVTPNDGTVTISHSVGVSGLAAWLDYTFNDETLATNQPATPIGYVPNGGNAGSGQTLTIDNSQTSAVSYNSDGTFKVRYTPYRSMTWPENYTVAVSGNFPDVENGCLVAFGTKSANYLALIRGANSNEIKLVKGKGDNTYTNIQTMAAENATAAAHLVVFTKQGNVFKVYCDGVNVATTEYDQTLGGGLQVGSIHGGYANTGVVSVMDNSLTDDQKNAVFCNAIRVYNYIISDAQMEALKTKFPYVSKGGNYTRSISADADLEAEGAWYNVGEETYTDLPTNNVEEQVTYYPDIVITTTAASTLTVNANMDSRNIEFNGAGKLTIASDGTHNISIKGSVTVNGPVSIKYGETDLSAVPVTIGSSGSVEFDFSDYDFTDVVTTTEIPVTGNTSDYGNKVTALYPESDIYRSFTLAYSESIHQYVLTVSPKRTVAQTVYAPAGTTQITDGMYVKMTADAETNDGLLISGDHLIINNTETIKLKQTSGFCTFEIQGGATVTVNNKTAEGYALDGETITITNGTLKLNYGNGDAKINSATINISENGALDNYGWLTVNGTLTINSNYNKTILNNSGHQSVSMIRGTGKIVKDGTGTITLKSMPYCTENSVTTKHPIEIAGGVLILNNNAQAGAITGSGTLNVPAATSISVESIATGTTLTGNGNVTTTTFPTTTPITTDWRGTVELAAGGDVGNLTTIFNAWGNANTVIKLNSVTGWFESDYTVNPTLNILSGATVNINNGYSNKEPKLTKVTGAGILQQAWDATGTNHKLHIETLTDFTGTLEGTNQPIIVDRIVLNRKPAVGDLLIKTSGTVSLSSLVVGWQPISAYSWDTETHDEVIGIYVTAKDDVAEKRDLANVIVLQYDGYIGAGVNKYTISLGDDKYTSMESYNDAIAAWTTVDDYVTPSVTINQPTSAFYRIKAGDKYLQDARKSDSATQRTLTDEEGADEDNETLFYLNHDNESNDDTFIGYQSGYGFGESVKLTQDTEHLNSMLFTESSELGKYTIQSQQGTCSSADDNEGYWGVDGSDLSREDDAASGACWTLEPATSVPVTFKKAGLGYATFFTPVALQIPDETNAYVCKLQESGSNAYALTFYEITAIKDADEKTTIPANTAVLLYKSGVKDGNKDEVVVNFPITSCKDEEGKDVKITQNSFYGTLATEAFNVNDPYVDTYSLRTYMVGDAATKVGFYKKTSGTTCAGFKAWLKTDHPVNNEVRIITINFDGDSDPTGIVEALGLEDENVEIYDLNGRKLSSYRKGINIVNGKKVLVK